MLSTALERLLRLHHEHLEQVPVINCRLESGLLLPNQPQQAAHDLVAVPAIHSTKPCFRQVQPSLADEQVLLHACSFAMFTIIVDAERFRCKQRLLLGQF